MAIKPMDEYFDSIIKANSKRKWDDVAFMFDMLDEQQKRNFISYLENNPAYQLDRNISDTHKRVSALLSI